MEAEISQRIDEHKRRVDALLDAPSIPTFETYAPQWRARVKREIEPATWKLYKQYLDLYVIPVFGSVRLDEIKPKMIRDFLREKAQTVIVKRSGETTYSPDTIRLMKASFSVVMSGAVEDEHIDRNPVLGVRLPGSRRKQPGFVSADEQAARIKPMDANQRARFIEACKDSRLGVLFTLRIMTGLRPSEPYAIHLDSIDWHKQQIAIEESIELHSLRRKATKTRKIRVVDVPTPLLHVLREHVAKLRKRAMKHGWGEPELLFPSGANTPLDHSNVVKEFKKVLKNAALPHFTPYDLRHTYAQLCR